MNHDHKYIYENQSYTFDQLEKHLETKIYLLITGKNHSKIDCNTHLLLLAAIKYLKKLNTDYSSQLQDILQKYNVAEKTWFLFRSSKVTTFVDITRFYIINLCEKDLVYIRDIHMHTNE